MEYDLELVIVYCHYIAPVSIAIIYRAMMKEMN